MKRFIGLYIVLIIFTSICYGQIDKKQWEEDIKLLKKELPRIHKNAFHTISKKQFESQIKILLKKINNLSDVEIALELQKITASIGDAHTRIFLPKNLRLRELPVRLEMFDDGLYIISINRDYDRFLGKKIIAINNTSIDSISHIFSSIISYENNFWLKKQLTQYYIMPQVYKYFGLSDNCESLLFDFEDGEKLVLNCNTPRGGSASVEAYKNLKFIKNAAKKYWFESNDSIIYIQYNQCHIDSTYLIENFVSDIMNSCDPEKLKKVIFDIRLNGGGFSEIFNPVIDKFKACLTTNKVSYYTAISRSTFSSGRFVAVYLKNRLNSLLIGEPTGGCTQAYGSAEKFTLPNSKIIVYCSAKYFNLMSTQDNLISPDIRIKYLSSDYLNGYDPVLDYIYKH